MTITAAALAGGNNGNDTTSTTRNMGSVTAGQLIIVFGMKYSPSADAFVASDVTKSAGTASIDTVQLDAVHGGDLGSSTNFGYTALWSAIVTTGGTLTLQLGGALAASYLLIAAEAFNGNWSSSRVVSTNGALLATDSTSSSSTGNASSAGAALFCAALQINSTAPTTITPDAAFTTVYENETGTDDNGSAIYRIVTGATTDAGDWTHGTSHAGTACSLVVYQEALSSASGSGATASASAPTGNAQAGASGAGATATATAPAGTASPIVKLTDNRLISKAGAPLANLSGITALIHQSVPSAAVPPAKLIASLTTNGSGMLPDINLSDIQISASPVWLTLMLDGSPPRGITIKLTPTVT